MTFVLRARTAIVRTTNEEAAAWAENTAFQKEILDKPWVVSEEEEKRARRNAEGLDREKRVREERKRRRRRKEEEEKGKHLGAEERKRKEEKKKNRKEGQGRRKGEVGSSRVQEGGELSDRRIEYKKARKTTSV